MNTKVCAVILAAGSGSRMDMAITKQRLFILGETVLHRAVRAFEECDAVTSIVVVSREDEYGFVSREVSDFKKVYKTVVGGRTRAQSSKLGFDAIPTDTDFVAIHDSARCLITPSDISKVIEDAKRYGAATASRTVSDTVKRVDDGGYISATESREELRMAQTPQIFKTEIYSKAVSSVESLSFGITDDNMLVERLGVRIFCTDIGAHNIKITYPGDILYAEFLLKGVNADVQF